MNGEAFAFARWAYLLELKFGETARPHDWRCSWCRTHWYSQQTHTL